MSRRVLAVLVQAAVTVALLAVVGAVGGVVWQQVWTPPSGLAYQGSWILDPAGPDYAFSGTGWYVLVALLAGSLSAGVIAWAWPRRELTTLVAIAVGSVLAGWLMFHVGHALGPADPQLLAADQPDFTQIPGSLLVAGSDATPRLFGFESSVFTAFPMGALVASVFVFLVSPARRQRASETSLAG